MVLWWLHPGGFLLFSLFFSSYRNLHLFTMSSMRLSMLRPQLGLLTKQPQMATSVVFTQLPRASLVLGMRAYSTNQGKQILLRDHGVFGKLVFIYVIDSSRLTLLYSQLCPPRAIPFYYRLFQLAFNQVAQLKEQRSKLVEVTASMEIYKWNLGILRNITYSVGLIKYKSQFEKWNSRKFLAEAEETYKDMNDAFAR